MLATHLFGGKASIVIVVVITLINNLLPRHLQMAEIKTIERICIRNP